MRVKRRLTHQDVLEVLTDLFCERGVPVHIRSDNQTVQFVEVSTPSFGFIHRSTFPVSSGAANIKVGTQSRGTSLLRLARQP